MTTMTLEDRVELLENEMRLLKSVVQQAKENQQPWWEQLAGEFKDDPVFDEIVEYGRKYRESLDRQTRL
ncbi:MAG: hypothetical protein L0229_14315 [Blastocatellia bacterium]|nr:hypothetical protein [Blastocatellia bacterium]